MNITNGDSAVGLLNGAGVVGDILPWRDVLHDGPVPGARDLRALSRVRAGFIADSGWADPETVRRGFEERDSLFLDLGRFERAVLWFEHDLYDQLQILQIIDALDAVPARLPPISLICTDTYLGMADPAQVPALLDRETEVDERMRVLARRAWAAFRAPEPGNWASLLEEDTKALPFLEGAVHRQLQEYPWTGHGLSRTAYQALSIIAQGEHRPGRVFGANQRLEERVYMGDLSFWAVLSRMADGDHPLITIGGDGALAGENLKRPILSLTASGESVLAGRCNALELRMPNHWIGGVRLGDGAPWCWDEPTRTIGRC
ncbi:MAG: hypothetical protein ACPGUC_03145 [Gammaproteobacteria bacterium]